MLYKHFNLHTYRVMQLTFTHTSSISKEIRKEIAASFLNDIPKDNFINMKRYIEKVISFSSEKSLNYSFCWMWSRIIFCKKMKKNRDDVC